VPTQFLKGLLYPVGVLNEIIPKEYIEFCIVNLLAALEFPEKRTEFGIVNFTCELTKESSTVEGNILRLYKI
jgi:hypothetical protein